MSEVGQKRVNSSEEEYFHKQATEALERLRPKVETEGSSGSLNIEKIVEKRAQKGWPISSMIWRLFYRKRSEEEASK